MQGIDRMTKRQIFRYAFTKSLPIMCSYVFLSLAYGLMMQNAGFAWYYSFLASTFVYTGAFQFVLITFLSSGASLLTVALTALLMNSRQVFYALTFLPDFRQTGRRLPYMIHSLTDETFAVDCTLTLQGRERREVMFWVAVLSQSYWVIGSVVGGVLGQLIPFDFEGIDFCMTALFLIIFVDQWEKATAAHRKDDAHLPALLGLAIGALCLLVFGESSFMLPALLITSALLLLWQRKQPAETNRHH